MKIFNKTKWLYLCILFCFFAANSQSYESDLDKDSDGSIGFADLFSSCLSWQSTGGETTDCETLYDYIRHWGTSGSVPEVTPTPTQTMTGDRTLSMNSRLPVELAEQMGVIRGQVNMPVHLSEVNGLTFMEIWIPYMPEGVEGSGFSVVVGNADKTSLTAGFELVEDATTVNFVDIYKTYRIQSDTPISHSGEGDLITIRMECYPTDAPPYPQDVELPIVFYQSMLKGADGEELAHETEDGSLLINPSGGPRDTSTPTSTEGPATSTPTETMEGVPTNTPSETATENPSWTPTATPTETGTPSGAAGSLQLVACVGQTYAGNTLYVHVDQLDAQGHIVNPGVEGGDEGKQVTLTVDGSAVFTANSNKNLTDTIDREEGLRVQILDDTPETVTVNASAPGLTDAQPVQLEFLPGGRIVGNITVPDGQGGYRAANPFEIVANVYVPGSTDVVASSMTQIGGVAGNYQTDFFEPGTYDISFSPISGGLGIPGVDLEHRCVEGFEVQEGDNTLDMQIEQRSGVRVFGEITTVEGQPELVHVQLFPVDGASCGMGTYMASIQAVQGQPMNYELTNIPPGEYRIFSTGASNENSDYFSTEEFIDVTVAATDVEQDLVMLRAEGVEITLLSPVDYARADNPPTLEWEMTGGELSDYYFIVYVDGRCEHHVAVFDDVRDTSLVYSGPELQPNNIYSWFVIAFSLEGIQVSTFGTSQYNGKFIVE